MNDRIQAREIYNACKTHGEIIDLIQEAVESRDTIAQLREVATAAREYLDISDVPRIHGDYCKYCEADVTAAHEKDCEFIIKVTSLVAALAALEQETK